MNITTLIFDLDDTLYPSTTGIWSLIRDRIESFMVMKLNYSSETVSEVRSNLFLEYGTTLRGLQSIHNIDPQDYLKYVHDIPVSKFLTPNNKLRVILDSYPQDKVIFTNADRWHADRILNALELRDTFQQVIDILDVTPFCKPMNEAYEIALSKLGVKDPSSCLMIDDNLKNIYSAKRFGMQTLWVSKNNPDDNSLLIPQIPFIEEIADVFPVEALKQ
jgi:pyrimidine 5'-nucleotidase